MSIFQKLYFPLIISLGLGACSPAATIHSSLPEPVDVHKFAPLDLSGDRLLFKTGIDLGKRHFSGIFLIKALPDSSIRVVFLSELGLNLLDMSYHHACFRVHSVKDFLDRNMIIRTLQEDFGTLLLDLSGLPDYEMELRMDGDDQAEVLRFRAGGGKSKYWYREEDGTYRIRRKEGLFKRTEMQIVRTPGLEIGIRHKGMRLHIHMQEVDTQD